MTEENNIHNSPLYQVTQQELLGKTYPSEKVVSVGTTLTRILDNNPNRLAWALINEGSVDVRVSIDPTISTTSGWLLTASGGFISMEWREDGETPAYQLFGIAAGVAANVRVREVLRS